MRLKHLTSEALGQVEQMVLWGINQKMIVSVSPVEKIESVVKDLYQSSGKKPPSGMSGSAVGSGLSVQSLMSFASMASTYRHLLINKSIVTSQAQLAAYGAYRDIWPVSLKSCNPNVWLGFARDFDSGNSGLYQCDLCCGPHIWQRGVYRIFKKCMWCQSTIRMPQVAVDAAWAAKPVRTRLGTGSRDLFG